MQGKLRFSMLLAAASVWCAGARAQMMVHAVTGVVKSINSPSTMEVAVEGGTTSEFNLSNKNVSLDFDNNLRADSVDASKFNHVGDFVVVYYYGFDSDQTAVAVKDLGAGPYKKVDGTVVNFDKHDRTMTIKDSAGKTEQIALSDHLVVDSGLKVQSGRTYDPEKGAQVRVTYTTAGAKNTAVFLRSWE
ncbi:MAG TPA: hypothetical protein VGM11_14135 [Acidobacteriaceae bacterium]|jgi:hypothetical protein